MNEYTCMTQTARVRLDSSFSDHLRPEDIYVEDHCVDLTFRIENLYSPNKHGRRQTISNINEIKQL